MTSHIICIYNTLGKKNIMYAYMQICMLIILLILNTYTPFNLIFHLFNKFVRFLKGKKNI